MSLQLSVLLTVACLATGSWHLGRCIRASDGGGVSALTCRISDFAHVIMSAAMLAMVWPWGMKLPAWPQLAVFALATVWFLAHAVSALRSQAEPFVQSAPPVHHALTMAAMVWMITTMPSTMAVSGSSSSSGGHHHSTASATADSTPVFAHVPSAVIAVNVAIGVFFILSALWWIAAAVDLGRGAWTRRISVTGAGTAPAHSIAALDSASHSVMSVAMGVMLLVMV